jgi:hypothetical protein
VLVYVADDVSEFAGWPRFSQMRSTYIDQSIKGSRNPGVYGLVPTRTFESSEQRKTTSKGTGKETTSPADS